MPGRYFFFCSSVPKRISVGPTVFTVTNGNGSPARCTSSKNTYCSAADLPCPPYSVGQP